MEEKKEISLEIPSGSRKGHIFKPCHHHPLAQRIHHRLRHNPSRAAETRHQQSHRDDSGACQKASQRVDGQCDEI